ncbi:DUF1036 domain-containing protein [Candidatus Viadribacter manganicus]|uniref:DUF1036 domain-containing protein n=1 Tax=Candidatus Viadribacter manganicus TaxID=1759059 RepID=A0A1B1AF23_9PROT|nr:DUF1036 domain-containing protein [Candidatus Viadribacter manganicus]ANP45152.1 hypothetical protein ATE48_04090 [Candidatus Viadribacter manganicus]
MALARLFTKGGALVALAAVASLAALAFAGNALAQQQERAPNGWQICNETTYVLEAATARPDGRSIQVQGWTRLRPGECRVAVGAPLARGTHYLYARTSSAHRGGRQQWTGDAVLCVDPSRQFQIENPPRCTDSYEGRRFRRVQINKRDSWRTSFSEASQYSQGRARQLGLQRLLEDAGYDVREGRRGADPRRIASAIAQFRTTARLQPNATQDQLIDALETAARRRAGQVGLTLCNRTRGRVWTAIARRRGEGWESRGWWALAPGGCVRTIDEVLIQEVYYVHASLDSPNGPRYLAAGGEAFCTSPARFAILGREQCEGRYYQTTLFTRIGARNRDGLVVDFEERDFLEAGVMPRQLTPAAGDDVDRAPATPARRGLDPPSAPTQSREE